MAEATAKTNRPLMELLDNELLGEGHELIDMMQAAAANSDSVEMTEVERCRVYLGSLLFAATIEGLNKAMERYPVSMIEMIESSWMMTGQAIAAGANQAFNARTPRERKLLRNRIKQVVMHGYDHFLDALDKAEKEQANG